MNTFAAYSYEAMHRVTQALARLLRPTASSLISPLVDVLMAGGLSIIVYFVLFLFVPKDENIFTWAIAFYYIAFIVNYPHFASSYLLLYNDSRSGFFAFATNKKFALKLWWAGVIVPLALIAYICITFSSNSASALGHLATAMYFFVGWHYVKQIYGCVIVLSLAKKVSYVKYEKWAILIPLYGLWALSFVNANMSGATGYYYEIPFSSLALPTYVRDLCYLWVYAGTIGLCIVFARKYFIERVVPPVAAHVAIISIYLWYLPTLSHPFYFYVIPFLHSIQYLLFVLAYKRNTVTSPTTNAPNKMAMNTFSALMFLLIPIVVVILAFIFKYERTIDILLVEYLGELIRNNSLATIGSLLSIIIFLGLWFRSFFYKNPLRRFIYFVLAAFTLGVVFFGLIPSIFDTANRMGALPLPFGYPQGLFGASLYLFIFTVFINIHHYFIDNVIWKHDNPYMRSRLFNKDTHPL